MNPIIGRAGFIGSDLVAALLDEGEEVRCSSVAGASLKFCS
jgi:nucleoside-diphosphate-sugar epimerase